MRIRIVGAGSVGLLLAGKLRASGAATVELVTRTTEQAQRLGQIGITVDEPEGALHVPICALSLEQAAVSQTAAAPDWTLLTVKQQAIDDSLLAALSAMAAPRCGIVCWQNGIGHVQRIAAAAPTGSVYVAVTTEGAKRVCSTQVAHTGSGTTEIGLVSSSPYGLSAAAQHQKKLIKILILAGFNAIMSKHIHTSVWNKLLVNAAINPLTAILRKTNGELLQSDQTVALMRAITMEGQTVAAAEGVATAVDIERRIEGVCRGTAGNRSSMLQDIEAGRRTENEWISGAIVRLAAQHGLQVPVSETIYRIVRELERGW